MFHLARPVFLFDPNSRGPLVAREMQAVALALESFVLTGWDAMWHQSLYLN